MSTRSNVLTLIDKFQNIKNSLKFVIPITLYIDNNYNKSRRVILLLIANILEKKRIFKLKNKEIQDNIIISIEKSCYEETIKKADELLIYQSWDNEKYSYLYYLYSNKVTKNLDSESEVQSDYLINLILSESVDITKIASMSSEELCPEKSKNIKESLDKRNNQKINIKTSTLYKCKNCGKKEVTIKSVQIRALDEAASLSITCVFCQYNWVQG